jgi:hypothetical protein
MIEKINDKAEEILNTVFGEFFPLTLITLLAIACLVMSWLTIRTLIYIIFNK